ncbi:hypothetical protein FCM35_KLT18040 [Carex littledalei]|uniref:Uncharacterized protein n=1 Tax=Carex littledalei TaxID=544730 RepID=A0A833VVW6_9POAL|nr:hypothetical protein FCM35_KLT18040 [Carex littledalei]
MIGQKDQFLSPSVFYVSMYERKPRDNVLWCQWKVAVPLDLKIQTIGATLYEVSSLILSYGGDMDSASTTNNSTDRIDNLTDRPHNSNGRLKIYERSNPKGAETLPPGIIVSESDLYQHRLWGNYFEDVPQKPKYLVVFTVAYQQKNSVNAAVQKFSENFTIMLFHYDGRVNEWSEFEWAQRAIHVSARKQAKWWYAKRFLHPDIVAAYDYIFIWDEDLGVDHFNAEEYIKLVKKYGLEISQPAVEAYWDPSFSITKRRNDTEVHREADAPEKCSKLHRPPCTEFIEIMAPVFSRSAWRCVWHMIQNDLPHGFGMDYVFRNCVEPSQDKIAVVDAQWIFHYGTPTLKDQGREDNRTEKVQEIDIRRYQELGVFMYRWNEALKDYCKEKGIVPSDYRDDLTLSQ